MRRAVLLFLALSAALPTVAQAACLDDPCPYSAVTQIGNQAGGTLRLPEAVAVDVNNKLWVGDGYSHVLSRFAQDGSLELAFGMAGTKDGQFGAITGIGVATNDNSIYVVDPDNDRIQHFTSEGQFIGKFGTAGTSLGQFSLGHTGNVSYPQQGGIAVALGWVWVADTSNHRIQRFPLGDVQGSSPDVSHAEIFGSGLNTPQGITVTGDAVYVADDKNNVAKRFDLSGNLLASYGAGGPASTAPGAFDAPFDVAVDALQRLFVIDDNNGRVQAWDVANPAGPPLIFGGQGTAPGQMSFPRAIAVGVDGVYVANTANGRVDKFSRDGVYLRSFGVDGRSLGQFISPGYLAAAPDGGVGVPDIENSRIQQFLPTGAFLTAYGGIGSKPEQLLRAEGMAFDSGFNAYIADTDNNRIVKRGFYGTVITTFGSIGVGPGQFQNPQGIAVDGGGRVFVADTGNDRVQRIDPDGQVRVMYVDPDLKTPRGVAVSPVNGHVYVASAKPRIVEFDAETGAKVQSFGTTSTFTVPGGIAIDGNGDVYVTDRSKDRVLRFSSAGVAETAWGGEGTGLGEFDQPAGVTVGCDGVLSVADEENNRVQRFVMTGVPTTPCQQTPAAPAPPPPPPPVDTPVKVTPPKPPTPKLVLTLKTKATNRALSRRTVQFTAHCDRNCVLTYSGKLQPRDTKKRPVRPLKSVKVSIKAGRRTTITLKLTKTDVKVLKRALGRHTKLRLTIKGRATATGAKSTTVTRTVSATR